MNLSTRLSASLLALATGLPALALAADPPSPAAPGTPAAPPAPAAPAVEPLRAPDVPAPNFGGSAPEANGNTQPGTTSLGGSPAGSPEPTGSPAPAPTPAPKADDKGIDRAPLGTVPSLFGGQLDIAKPGPGPYLSDFADTRVTFALTDDDFLSDAGRTTPSSPRLDFGARPGNETFFNNIDRRDTLRETLTHLVIYRKMPGYFYGLDTEAAIVARFVFLQDPANGAINQSFRDDSTYIRTTFYPLGDTTKTDDLKFEATFMPFNSVRYRLGWLWDISWGGPEIFPARNVAAPGVKFQVSYNRFKWLGGYAYAGAKTARMLDERINEIQSNWGGLGGAGVDIARVFSLETGGGIFQRGTNPLTGVKGEPVLGYGISNRAMLHINTTAQSGLDFRQMSNDIASTNFFLQNKPYANTWYFTLAAEFTWLQHTLQDPDNVTSTLRQNARAAALSARLKLWYFQFTADAILRDLSFVLYNRPGFVPFQAFPGDNQRNIINAGDGECPSGITGGPCQAKLQSSVQPEALFATGISAYIPVVRLTPAVIWGIQKPATFQGFLPTAVANSGVPDQAGSQTVVVRNANSVDVLPCAEYSDPDASGARTCKRPSQPTPIVTTRLALKWDMSDMLSVVAEQVITVDRNRTELINDVDGQNTTRRAFYEARAPEFAAALGAPSLPLRWGGGMYVQARF